MRARVCTLRVLDNIFLFRTSENYMYKKINTVSGVPLSLSVFRGHFFITAKRLYTGARIYNFSTGNGT